MSDSLSMTFQGGGRFQVKVTVSGSGSQDIHGT